METFEIFQLESIKPVLSFDVNDLVFTDYDDFFIKDLNKYSYLNNSFFENVDFIDSLTDKIQLITKDIRELNNIYLSINREKTNTYQYYEKIQTISNYLSNNYINFPKLKNMDIENKNIIGFLEDVIDKLNLYLEKYSYNRKLALFYIKDVFKYDLVQYFHDRELDFDIEGEHKDKVLFSFEADSRQEFMDKLVEMENQVNLFEIEGKIVDYFSSLNREISAIELNFHLENILNYDIYKKYEHENFYKQTYFESLGCRLELFLLSPYRAKYQMKYRGPGEYIFLDTSTRERDDFFLLPKPSLEEGLVDYASYFRHKNLGEYYRVQELHYI